MKKKIMIIILLIAIDQLIKFAILSTIGVSSKSITILPHVLQLTYVENSEAAFGLFSSKVLLIILDIVIIIAIIKALITTKYELEPKTKLGLSIILAGGISNLIDRLFRGYVIDYIDISEIFNYPIFNIADCYIVVGIILMMATLIIKTIKTEETTQKTDGK